MAKLQKQTKQNPKLEQRELKDGRIALYLEYYLGRSEEVVKDADGKVVYLCFVLVANLSRLKFKSLLSNRLTAIFCAQNRHTTVQL